VGFKQLFGECLKKHTYGWDFKYLIAINNRFNGSLLTFKETFIFMHPFRKPVIEKFPGDVGYLFSFNSRIAVFRPFSYYRFY